VGADERGFQVVQRGAVDFFADRDYVLDALGQVLAGTRDRFLHAIEKTGLLFFVQAAEKGLNHDVSARRLYRREGKRVLWQTDQERRVSTVTGSGTVSGPGKGAGTPAGVTGFGILISPRKKTASKAVTAVGSKRLPERFSMMRTASNGSCACW